MSEGAEKSVEELLAEAAQVTEANSAPKAKKARTPKGDAGADAKPAKEKAPAKTYPVLDAEGNAVLDEQGNPVTTTEKPAKAKKEGKLYPQANEDGTAKLDEDGNAVQGPYATRFKEPKAPKAPRLDAEGNPIVRQSNVFALEARLNKVEGKGAGYREGSKRKANFDLIPEGGITVAEYYEAGGGKAVVHTFLVWYVNEDQSVSVTTGESAE